MSPEEFEALYNRGLRQVEIAAEYSFPCRTKHCPGCCRYKVRCEECSREKDSDYRMLLLSSQVNEYTCRCEFCGKLNCILCKAQHEGKNCQEYQEDLKVKAANDEAAQQTQAMLEVSLSLEPPEFMQTRMDTIRTKKPAQDIPVLCPAPVAFPKHRTWQDPMALQFPPSNQRDDAFYRGPSGPSQFQGVPLRTPAGGIRVMLSEVPNNPPQIGPISPLAPPVPPRPTVGWECPACTYCNLPIRPDCEMCDGPRPEGYEPPPDYIMTEAEKKFVNEDKQQDAMLQEVRERKSVDNGLCYS